MYHFVNGGGGAYLSIGTALDWPKQPPVARVRLLSRADALTAALDAQHAAWKQPLWLWVKTSAPGRRTPEAVAAAFDYDRAPFFQSFMEVRVEGSTNTRPTLALRLERPAALARPLRARRPDSQRPGGQRPRGILLGASSQNSVELLQVISALLTCLWRFDPMATDPTSIDPFSGLTPVIQEDLKKLKAAWLWFLILGVCLIFLGLLALGYATFFTIASVEVVGVFLIIGGAIYIGGSFFTGSWGGFFGTLLTGVLQLIVGLICFRHPAEAAIVYTLLMAAFFMIGGLFRIVTAVVGRFSGWGWVAANGVVTLILGLMIWEQMPFSGLWVIGTFLGIDLLFNGWSYVLLGINSRRLPV